MKRVLVFGSRKWASPDVIYAEMRSLKDLIGDYILVHGACPGGADRHAKMHAFSLNLADDPHPAQWSDYGKSAGPIRNSGMVKSGLDYALGYILNGSAGSEDMLKKLEVHHVPYKVTRLEMFRTFDFPKEI